MRGIVGFLAVLLVPLSAEAQSGDPIDRPVKIEDLSPMYKEHSDNRSNREFEISLKDAAGKTAQSAVGVRFTRDSKVYEITQKARVEDTYEPLTTKILQRVIYTAQEGEMVKKCEDQWELKGLPFTVAIDYRPDQPASYEAYVAEVTKRRSGERWEFVKVTP